MKYTIVLTLVIIATAIHGRDGLDVKETVKGAATKLEPIGVAVSRTVKALIQDMCNGNVGLRMQMEQLITPLKEACKENGHIETCKITNVDNLYKFTCQLFSLGGKSREAIVNLYRCAQDKNVEAARKCVEGLMAEFKSNPTIVKILKKL